MRKKELSDFQKVISQCAEQLDRFTDMSLGEMEKEIKKIEKIYDKYSMVPGFIETFPNEKLAKAICRIGLEYYEKQCYLDSLDWFGRARIFYDMSSERNSLSAADCKIWLATISYELGNYTESLKWSMDALLMRENLLGKNFQNNLMIFFILAKNYMMQGYYMAAQELFGKIYDNTEDEDIKAEVFRHMGIVSDKQGDNKNALNWFLKATTLKKKLYGQDSFEVATLYNSIGIIYDNAGKYDEAEKYLMRALEIKERQLSPNDISLTNTYHNIGKLEINRGRYEEALVWLQKALEMRASVLDMGHPLIADTLLTIGGAHIKANNWEEALYYNKKALAIYIENFGRDHPMTVAVINNVRKIEIELGGMKV